MPIPSTASTTQAGPRLCTHSALTLHLPCTHHAHTMHIQAGPRLRTRDSRGDAVRRGRGARASRPAEADRGSSLPLTTCYLVTYYFPRDDTPRRLCPEPPLLSTPQPSVLQPHPRPHPSPQTPSPSPQTEAFQAPAHSPRPPPSPPSSPCYPMAPHAIQVTTLTHIYICIYIYAWTWKNGPMHTSSRCHTYRSPRTYTHIHQVTASGKLSKLQALLDAAREEKAEMEDAVSESASLQRQVDLTPCILHLASYILPLTPYILHLTSTSTSTTLHLYILQLTSYTLHLTLHLTSHLAPLTSHLS